MQNQPQSSRQIVLQPLPKAIGINPAFCVNAQKTLLMKEKVFSLALDAFHVHDENNQEVLQVRAKTFSIHHQKEFFDPQNNPLFTLKHKPFSLPRQYYGETIGDEKQLFHIQDKWHLGGARQVVTFQNLAAGTGEAIELHIAGQWIDRHATIKLGDQLVAEITRTFFNARQILGGLDTYYVTVAPGMDYSLIAAIAVALDERENENKN
ncbi:DUF567 domain containing protein [Hyaloscypha variabilis]|uniref:DUF567-domain-containing protein n=1 Tax=Hyaloscypha variabilis (strain UAMH 11265 / GT02V1 / F) TaxID=1149755 RepID=A0A2J6R546_HYAVF|nr:DUF567-domain-containing protein [Hyaloscypha variabilis F]